MRANIIFLPALFLGITAATATEATEVPPITSVHAELPSQERTFEGSGSDVVNTNCLICHSAGMVLVQPRLPRATWQGIVEKMRKAYKAPVADEDVEPIVSYLSQLKGAE